MLGELDIMSLGVEKNMRNNIFIYDSKVWKWNEGSEVQISTTGNLQFVYCL